MSLHYWPAPLGEPLAVVCAACGVPLVPMGYTHDNPYWRADLAKLGNRDDCGGSVQFMADAIMPPPPSPAWATAWPTTKESTHMHELAESPANPLDRLKRVGPDPFAEDQAIIDSWASTGQGPVEEELADMSLRHIQALAALADSAAVEHRRRASAAESLASGVREHLVEVSGIRNAQVTAVSSGRL